ncbi:hypothetical protein B296_00008331 [Ensete ventricosum]|uniref:Uncharacterized protein n=1 Tax=Ensete ventricosum TaxID=4639 RepID=A0A426YNC6_ENSVE|nr:hypothetical protein B296_00008331 [Ensete ventricosum]
MTPKRLGHHGEVPSVLNQLNSKAGHHGETQRKSTQVNSKAGHHGETQRKSTQVNSKAARERERERERERTSNGNIGEPVSIPDVEGIRDDTQERLGHHGEVPSVLNQLKCGRAKVEGMNQVEVEGQPWEAPETLHPVPEPTQGQHLTSRFSAVVACTLLGERRRLQCGARQGFYDMGFPAKASSTSPWFLVGAEDGKLVVVAVVERGSTGDGSVED